MLLITAAVKYRAYMHTHMHVQTQRKIFLYTKALMTVCTHVYRKKYERTFPQYYQVWTQVNIHIITVLLYYYNNLHNQDVTDHLEGFVQLAPVDQLLDLVLLRLQRAHVRCVGSRHRCASSRAQVGRQAVRHLGALLSQGHTHLFADHGTQP